MVSKSHPKVSLTKQCEYLGLCRSSFYVTNKGESSLNLELMDHIDKHYLEHPYKGCPSMYTYLTMDLEYDVSRNRIERLYYKVMGLRAIVPGPHTSKRNKDHAVYPYLLRGLEIKAPNQVWACDITYIGVATGYIYLFAIIDLYSRYVVGWDLSNTMNAEWCKEVLKQSVEVYGRPQIINTDQGSQFTSEIFTNYVLKEAQFKLSMDGKGRATDNAFIERLWRSVKYEKIHLYKPEDGVEAYMLLVEYFNYYNYERRHSMIGNLRPAERYNLAPSLPHSNNSNNKAQKVELMSFAKH